MATPRKHWFRVADALGAEPLSNDELSTIIRLMCALNTRWARDGLTSEQACRITFRPGDLMACTGSASLVRARRIIQALAAHFSLTVSASGAYTTIEWPKWAVFQELPSPTEGNSKETSRPRNAPSAPSPSPSPATSPEEKRESAPSAPVADAPSPTRSRRVLIEKPESFDEPAKERLRAWAARKGIDRNLLNVGLEEFRDWVPLKPPYRRTSEQWEGAFKRILREGIAAGKIGKTDAKPKPAYRRDENGQVLVPNEWRGLA